MMFLFLSLVPPPPPPPPIVQATRAPTLKEMIEQNKQKLGQSPSAAKHPSVTSQQGDTNGDFDIVNAIRNRGALRKISTALSLESTCAMQHNRLLIIINIICYSSKR